MLFKGKKSLYPKSYVTGTCSLYWPHFIIGRGRQTTYSQEGCLVRKIKTLGGGLSRESRVYLCLKLRLFEKFSM